MFGLISRDVFKLCRGLTPFGRKDKSFEDTFEAIDHKANALSKVMCRAPDVDDTPLSVRFGATADAAGEDTKACVDVDAVVKDYDGFSLAFGSMRAEAAASGGPAFATTDLSLDVEGADVIIEVKRGVTGSNFEKEALTFLCIDFDFIDLDKPIELDFERFREISRERRVSEGNEAVAEFDVEVVGEDTFLETEVEAFSVEDAFSGSLVDVTGSLG